MSARPRSSKRVERDTRNRRARARSHLQRARRRRSVEPTREVIATAALFTLGLVAGMLIASPAIEHLARWWQPGPIPLQSIAVQGQTRLESRAVAEATGLEPDSDTDQIDLAEVTRRLSAHPWILSARALRLPLAGLGQQGSGSRIVVKIREREPLAVWHSDASEQRRWVDASGTLFAEVSQAESESYPLLQSARTFPAGEPNPLVARAVALAREIPGHGIEGPVTLRLPDEGSAEGWVVRPADFAADVVLGANQLEQKLARLSRLLAEKPKVVADARRIDLRFADRVVLQGGAVSQCGGNKWRQSADARTRPKRAKGLIRRPY